MGSIKESLTFEMLLLPQYSKVLPSQADISLSLTENIAKSTFFIICNGYSNRSKMAIAMASEGGMGITIET